MNFDIDAIREKAERCEGVLSAYIIDVAGMPEDCIFDLLNLARHRRWLTDPTPLTVERLVEAGGKMSGKTTRTWQGTYILGRITITGTRRLVDDWSWSLDCPGPNWKHIPVQLRPRTVGELRQLLARMEG